MPIRNVYYAVLVLCERGTGLKTISFFTGYDRAVIRKVMTTLGAANENLNMAYWSVNDRRTGAALEARCLNRYASKRWRRVPGHMLYAYRMNGATLAMAANSCDTINNDGTVTSNNH